MPHKHKRRQNDPSIYDLPPTLIAKSLPVRDPQSKAGKGKGKSRGKSQSKDASSSAKQTQSAASRRKSALDDDTPRAFQRLMQFQTRAQQTGIGKASKKRKRGVEDTTDDSDNDSDSTGNAPAVARNEKKKKPNTTTTITTTTTEAEPKEGKEKVSAPRILPGEKLSDFAARVDREMPLSGMNKSNKPAPSADMPKIRDHRQTKHEKHLRRLQAQWREDDARIREREAAERDEREAEMEEQLDLWKEWEAEAGKGKAKKKGNGVGAGRKKVKGGADGAAEYDDGPDPWAKLKKKRAAVNPFDVAQEPPQLKKPKEVFKVRGGAKVDVANVPASVGSLRRREELANERRNIVEEYRRLMAEKRQ